MFLLIFAFLIGVQCENTVTLRTKLGTMRGVSLSRSIKGTLYDYNEFRGIPYAKPPVGNLRFEKPVSFGPVGNYFDATNFGPSCFQFKYGPEYIYLPNYNQSEDCLHLNIYKPKSASSSNRKSVMIWIHGGGYFVGQAMFYDASSLSVIGDVVVVTLNYRLGVFGFLSSADDILPGNYGLWDQKLAINWVKENIDSFGGDPNSITIFGESAGGFSAMLQSLHAENKGKFHRLISQSGTADSILAMAKPSSARRAATEMSSALHCGSSITLETVRCLKGKSAGDILQHFFNSTFVGGIPKFTMDYNSLDITIEFVYAPVVDGQFLNETPSKIFRDRDSLAYEFYKSLDVVIGNIEGEGSLILNNMNELAKLLPFNVMEGISSDFLCNHLIKPYVTDNFGNNPALEITACARYSSNGSIGEQGVKAIDFYGDVTMYIDAVQSLNVHAIRNTNANRFQYLHKKKSGLSANARMRQWIKYASHGAEVAFLFPAKSGAPMMINSTDMGFAVTMMKYWSNFAKTG